MNTIDIEIEQLENTAHTMIEHFQDILKHLKQENEDLKKKLEKSLKDFDSISNINDTLLSYVKELKEENKELKDKLYDYNQQKN